MDDAFLVPHSDIFRAYCFLNVIEWTVQWYSKPKPGCGEFERQTINCTSVSN